MKPTTEHRWELIAIVGDDRADHWEYCVRCGVLACNQQEFWIPGDPQLLRKNPVGRYQEPPCVPVKQTEYDR